MSTGERYFVFLCNFLTTVLVSRILTPQEIGVSVVGMAVLSIALAGRDFSSSNFVIQRPVLSAEDIRGTFSVMLLITVAIAVALTFLSPTLAAAYREPNLVPYLYVVCACIFVDLVSIQVLTLLRREMAFGKVAAINLSGAATGAVTCVVLAIAGFSYMSFVWSWLASGLVTAGLSLFIRPQFWVFRPSFHNWREIVAFGGFNGATVVLHKIYESLPVLVLGRVVSPNAAAIFNRSVMVCQIPDKLILGGATGVILPAFSQAVRQGKDVKQAYLNALEMITGLHWPALLVLAALAHPIVGIILGPQWGESAPLVQIIALAYLGAFSIRINYPVMVSLGAIRFVFLRSLIIFPVAATVMTASVLLGGLEGAAWSMAFIIPFQAFVSLIFVCQLLRMGPWEIAASLRRSGIAAAMSVLGPAIMVAGEGFNFHLSFLEAVFAVALAAAGWVGALWATDHPLIHEMREGASAIARKLPLRTAAAYFEK